MPFMTSFERFARIEELLAGIQLGLELKFGAAGLQLMPEISQLTDVGELRAVREAIKNVRSPEELRRIWTS